MSYWIHHFPGGTRGYQHLFSLKGLRGQHVTNFLHDLIQGGQSPEALFITCSDSRIETGLITQTDPGELFICRNAGNIVPPHTNHTGGMTASIESLGVLSLGLESTGCR